MNNSSSQLSFPALYVIAEKKKTDEYFTAIVKFLKQNRDVRT